MRVPARCALSLAALLLFTTSALAWGPRTRQAVITTAMNVLSKEGVVQLSRLEKDLRDGAAAPDEVVAKLYPGFSTGVVRAIETEMYLLDSVRGEVVDPYFAYRLGVLGRLVASLTAPLAGANPTYRDRYYADVDKNIQQVPLKSSARKQVDPAAYFARVQRLADTNQDLILKDYQDGLGFAGVAKGALPDDISRSIDTVADMWYTILVHNVRHANISDIQLREYVVNALDFYIGRGNEAEIDANYARLIRITPKTTDMAKRIGDRFYDAGLFDRAIAEYRVVLAAEPHRKDVVTKIASYYVKLGDDALTENHLEQALEAYAKAAQTDPLHPSAEGKRLQVQALIAERDARMESARTTIEAAAQLQTESEQLAMQHKFSDALNMLRQAQGKYESVTDEFPVEAQAASAGLANIAARIRELKGELVGNAQTLSGSNFAYDMQRLAAAAPGKPGEQALRSILTNQLNAEMNKLKGDLQDSLTIK